MRGLPTPMTMNLCCAVNDNWVSISHARLQFIRVDKMPTGRLKWKILRLLQPRDLPVYDGQLMIA
jgi:hypothetical protein